MEALSARATDRETAPSQDRSYDELTLDLYAVLIHLNKRSAPAFLRATEDLELSMPQIKTIHILDGTDDQALSLSVLGKWLAVSPAATSRTVDGLHKLGYLERTECPDDRRVKQVRITDTGRDLARRMHAARLETLEDFSASLEPGERRALLTALAPLLAREEIAGCRAHIPESKPATPKGSTS